MKRASKISAVLFAMVVSSSGFCQQRGQSPDLSGLLASDWLARWASYSQIKDSQQALQRPEVRNALLQLLKRENDAFHMRYTDAKGNAISISEKFGEEYVEYYADLLGVVEKLVDWQDEHQVCILAESAYNPDSSFATELATKGGAQAVPCLLQMAKNTTQENDRYEAIPVLAHLYSLQTGLPLPTRQEIFQSVMASLRDPSIGVRLATVRALGTYGTPEVLPALQKLTESDPASRVKNGQPFFMVRDGAAKAIQSIQERTKANNGK